MGASGSGKSTLGALLTKLYTPSSGTISLGDSQLSELRASSVRQRILHLPQSSILFEETVGRNIALGKGDDWNKVTREEILVASQKVMLYSEDLPNGIDTVVGEGGMTVSGGQRQRIALARAILRDPEVLILDEATSALDYVSQSHVNDAIRSVRQGKTTVIITHDVSMIDDTDFIYVMKDGQVVEKGDRRNLMGTEGHFYQMARAFERITQHAEATAPKRRNAEDVARAAITGHVTELKYSEANGAPVATVTNPIPKNLHNLGEVDVEANLEGETAKALTIWEILKTVPKCLTFSQDMLMFVGFLATVGNGAAIPAFGFTLSELIVNLFQPNTSGTLYWALAVLGVAAFDGLTTSLKIYLLESSAEKWVSRSRNEGIKRIFGQDCLWFVRYLGQPSIIAARVINSGEEMRPIVGRFAGNLLNTIAMLALGTIWALIVGWELTLIGLALTPIIFFSTKAYVAICEKFQKKMARQVEQSTMVLHEVMRNIRGIMGLGLQKYFEAKFLSEVVAARAIASGRVFWIGSAFGVLEGVGYFSKGSNAFFAELTTALVFWYGAHLVSQGKYSVSQMLTVFTLIIFSTTTAAQTIQLGMCLSYYLTRSPTNFKVKRSGKSRPCASRTLEIDRGVHRQQKNSYQGRNRV